MADDAPASGSAGTPEPATELVDDAGAQPTSRRWLRALGWVIVVVGLTTVLLAMIFLVLTRNPAIDEFYDPPDRIVGAPGTVLRSEPFLGALPPDSVGWRVMYVSTDADDFPIAVTGLVVAPAVAPEGPRPVLAWAHGTTGIGRACAPSISEDPFAGIPDMTGALEEGWVITLTDYPGLGTPGPHPYLVGQSEGRAVLDSVRAAHDLDLHLDDDDIGGEIDDRYAIWGHSQGGHAALFAGQLSETYMPEQELVGVAALAPATLLQDNLAAIEGTDMGKVLTVFTIASWTAVYPDLPDDTLSADASRPAQRLTGACTNQPSRPRVAIDGALLPDPVAAIDPFTDPAWTARLEQNSPDPAGVVGPLLVAQGLADEIIVPPVTEEWTRRRCAAGGVTQWQTFAGVTHEGIVDQGGELALDWTIERFEGAEPPADVCPP